jgi:hypothetical protein
VSRPAVSAEECLLDARECAARLRCHSTDWWKIASENLILKRGRVERGSRTFWLQSVVTRYLRSLAGGETKPNPRVERMRAARTAKAVSA